MRKTRMAPLGVIAALLLAALMLAMPVGSAAAAGGEPVASAAKKKCKKKGKGASAAKKKKCKKKKRGGGFYLEGRYAGTYAENNVDLFFNVLGGRVYTGPFDAFYLDATCYNADPNYTGPQVTTDSTAYEPVQATIGPGGSFAGSGVYNTGFTSHPWTLTGQISGGSITGTFTSSYTDTYGDPCSGSTSFTAQWYGSYTL